MNQEKHDDSLEACRAEMRMLADELCKRDYTWTTVADALLATALAICIKQGSREIAVTIFREVADFIEAESRSDSIASQSKH